MAGAVAGGKEAFALYPAAFGYLVATKAYSVTRAAAIPRVQPRGVSLVTANSRVLLGGIVAVAIATPIGLLLMQAGPEWVLRFAFVVFARGHRAVPRAAPPGGLGGRRGRRPAVVGRHRRPIPDRLTQRLGPQRAGTSARAWCWACARSRRCAGSPAS